MPRNIVTPSSTSDLDDRAKQIMADHLTAPFDIDSIPFELLSSLRYDPGLYNGTLPLAEAIQQMPLDPSFFFLLPYHAKRLNKAIDYFDFNIKHFTESLLLSKISEALASQDKESILKIRILAQRSGQVKLDILPETRSVAYDVNCGITYDIYLDSKPMTISPFTSFKTTHRNHYTEARVRSIPPGAENTDVLLYNAAEQVTESSVCNVAFWRDVTHPITGEVTSKWLTPPLSVGCISGVVRQSLLDSGKIFEGPISVKDLTDGEEVLLMNGILGTVKAKLIT
ncbi:hypothetical protein CANARDRAFT_202516 [[Candida] arabinofermentans NRRL YB-2248]|uniref:Aminodeoxychorismate lyase n=1 Tax=[Candida] arabinofermentans NRRL YB-2248 TaxID=983967 RepID=A0A1E4SW34_9ASCO|nr:hypothetical protein CANARDRAFT_202516 [[Candida] arabinofermentans NRRL YB-2248]